MHGQQADHTLIHSPAVKPVTHKLHSHYYYSIQGIATTKNRLLPSSETELKTNNTRREKNETEKCTDRS